jgi:hypothetical protein
MDINKLMPNDVKIIDIENSTWNCDKCLFFKEKECECMAVKRLLFGQALHDDCDDCKRPFVLKCK